MEYTVTRYAITHLTKEGDRTIIGANQRRNFFDTREQAEKHKADILASNDDRDISRVFGLPLEVRPVECVIMKDGKEGDAVSVWFDGD